MNNEFFPILVLGGIVLFIGLVTRAILSSYHHHHHPEPARSATNAPFPRTSNRRDHGSS
jgi:hypothetical protein